ncbi:MULTISPECIES: type II toxin-antitoxin system RelB/DinJ family antitoxin [Levilactobacillus]|uniref:Type II toxin-antitoxin system RelB/DinJ family antitoxin n=1 Tax=Levilactobacillus tongjiangensis TaxID=2486023 RepID=A0ABW1SQK0_9LACO|nr:MULTISPECIES: type II toxin-antitoxin system RelB/DinJ family antitoxin [Levilactobacillus]
MNHSELNINQPEHLDVALVAGLKEQATKVYAQYDMSLTTAINLFLQQSVADGSLPFDVELSKQALRQEVEREAKMGETQTFASVEELWQDLNDNQ